MAVQRGLTVLERRYRTPHGEIDLIAAADNAIVFVEVKARRTRDDAAYSITPRQWERLAAAAMHYLSVYHTQNNFSDPAPQNTAPDMRFDVVLVDAAGRATWMENARRFDDW
jgi:putative endonuclease